MPVYMALAASYVFAVFLTCYLDPYAVLLAVAAQVVVFLYLSFRP
jgi:hypothetical protein